jgi:sugar/nucleoside kinase (ribokinase family)
MWRSNPGSSKSERGCVHSLWPFFCSCNHQEKLEHLFKQLEVPDVRRKCQLCKLSLWGNPLCIVDDTHQRSMDELMARAARLEIMGEGFTLQMRLLRRDRHWILASAAPPGSIIVVGSINRDVHLKLKQAEEGTLPEMPTFSASGSVAFDCEADRSEHQGGKGLNLASAAGKLSGGTPLHVWQIGQVGPDYQGQEALDHLKNSNVDTHFIAHSPTLTTGLGSIVERVGVDGGKSQYTVRGANSLDTERVAASIETIAKEYDPHNRTGNPGASRMSRKTSVLLTDVEIPSAATARALEKGQEESMFTAFLLSPVVDSKHVNPDSSEAKGSLSKIFDNSNLICFAKNEILQFNDDPKCQKLRDFEQAARRSFELTEQSELLNRPSKHLKYVLVCLEPGSKLSFDLTDELRKVRQCGDGSIGVLVFSKTAEGNIEFDWEQYPSELISSRSGSDATVKNVSSSGVSQAFLGSLAYILSQAPHEQTLSKATLHVALPGALHCAALSVQRPGASPSYPMRTELPNAIITLPTSASDEEAVLTNLIEQMDSKEKKEMIAKLIQARTGAGSK